MVQPSVVTHIPPTSTNESIDGYVIQNDTCKSALHCLTAGSKLQDIKKNNGNHLLPGTASQSSCNTSSNKTSSQKDDSHPGETLNLKIIKSESMSFQAQAVLLIIRVNVHARFIYLFIYLFVCLFVSEFIYLFIYLLYLKSVISYLKSGDDRINNARLEGNDDGFVLVYKDKADGAYAIDDDKCIVKGVLIFINASRWMGKVGRSFVSLFLPGKTQA